MSRAYDAANEIMSLCFKIDDFESRNESFKRHYYRERDDISEIIHRYFPFPSIPIQELERLIPVWKRLQVYGKFPEYKSVEQLIDEAKKTW